MENLFEYLLTIILRNADEVHPFGKYCGEDAFTVTSAGCYLLTASEIRKIRSLFAAHWRYFCDSERRDIFNSLKKMKQ